jgi:hypothetical protein
MFDFRLSAMGLTPCSAMEVFRRFGTTYYFCCLQRLPLRQCLRTNVTCSSSLKMEVIRPVEAPVNCQFALSNIPEGSTVSSFRRYSLRPQTKQSVRAFILLPFPRTHEDRSSIYRIYIYRIALRSKK